MPTSPNPASAPQPSLSPASAAARRFTDSPVEPPTVIGPGTTIKGELYGTGSLDLAGTLDGPCQVSGHCIVRASGRIAGDVTATSVVVEGEVTGTTVVAEKVEIGTSGRVRANIRARVIAIAEGAYFAGEVHMEGREGQSAPIAFKEKRKGEPVA